MILAIREEIQAAFPQEQNLFDQMMAIKGKVYRSVERRETLEFVVSGHSFFIKKHFGVGWREIFKSLFMGNKPVLSARNEFIAIKHLQSIGMHTPDVVGYGERGWNPANIESFIITKALVNKISVNDLLVSWRETKPNVLLKRALITRIAEMVSSMHLSGMNHRDCYLHHFLIDEELPNDFYIFPIYMIDLHRAQLRRKTPHRWIVKDLAGLYFSSMNIRLTRNDCYRFMKAYSGKPLRQIVVKDQGFWNEIKERAEKLFQTKEI